MKPVFLIAIVAVAMIGILSPMTVFGGIMTETLRPINIDKTIYSPGEIITISGNIKNSQHGIYVDLVLTNPDNTTEEFRVICKSNGDYSLIIMINSKYKLGEYSITSHYNSKFIGKETFSIMTKSEINDKLSVIESSSEPTKTYYVENNLVYTMEYNWMEPTIRQGDVVIAEKIPFGNIKIGDIIMYQQPAYPDDTGVSKVIAILNNNPKIIRASSFAIGSEFGPEKWLAGISSPITENEYIGKVIKIMSPKAFAIFPNDKIIEPVEEPVSPFRPITISNSDLQKKLDEYWYCSIGIDVGSSSNQDCVKYDKNRTVGTSSTEIARYQIEKDSTLTFTYEDSDISTNLEIFRDQSMHQVLWDTYTSITPPEILSDIAYFVISTDDYNGGVAYVNANSDNFLKFDLSVDPIDMVPSGIKMAKQLYISTLIHENAHILSLDASQGDNKPVSDDAANSPDMYKQEMQNGERSCAPNYYNDFVGCMNQNSYLNAFFQKFWAGIYHDFKWELEFDDYETFIEHNDEFHLTYEKDWLTEYSSTNPDEDFAESFMAFVLKEKPSNPTFAEQKILFFYQYPELVEIRDFTRSVIATSEFCDNRTVFKDGKCQQPVTPSPQQQPVTPSPQQQPVTPSPQQQPVTPSPQQQPQQSQGGGCLIATATYRSEMSQQVQQLRELRDNQLLQTESGTAFMGTFNDIYYSFSPIIADYERENPLFKEAVKIAITPMISSLSLMENAESESEVLSIGISVIALNLAMYLGVPVVLIVGIRKKF